MIELDRCRMAVEGPDGTTRPCGEVIGVAGRGHLFCETHWTRVEMALDGRQRQRRRAASDVDVLVLSARLEDALRRNQLAESKVYYVARRPDGLIKIGYSIHPEARLEALGRKSDVELLVTEPGGHRVESERHKQFRSLRAEGEWFRPAPRLLHHVKRLQAAQERLTLRAVQGKRRAG